MNEVTPGIVDLVAWLEANGFPVKNSDDGITNYQLRLPESSEGPFVDFTVARETAFDDADRLRSLLEAKGVELGDEEGDPFIEVLYVPYAETAMMCLHLVDDELFHGILNPELPRQRLEYQIRYCNHWINNPPDTVDKTEIQEIIQDLKDLRQGFTKKLAAL